MKTKEVKMPSYDKNKYLKALEFDKVLEIISSYTKTKSEDKIFCL